MFQQPSSTVDFSSFHLSRSEDHVSDVSVLDDESLRGLHLMRLSTWAAMFTFAIVVWALAIWIPLKLAM